MRTRRSASSLLRRRLSASTVSARSCAISRTGARAGRGAPARARRGRPRAGRRARARRGRGGERAGIPGRDPGYPRRPQRAARRARAPSGDAAAAVAHDGAKRAALDPPGNRLPANARDLRRLADGECPHEGPSHSCGRAGRGQAGSMRGAFGVVAGERRPTRRGARSLRPGGAIVGPVAGRGAAWLARLSGGQRSPVQIRAPRLE